MLDRIWNAILELSAKLVIPDWGSLVGLIPLALLLMVGLWLLLTIRRFATAGPTRRALPMPARRPPSGVHVGPRTYAPVLGAVGVFLVLWGIVVGGIGLWLGVAAMVLALLYWGAEGLRDYDHLAHGEAVDTVVAVREPPPGVHIPAPSFRPIVVALALTVLLVGLVFPGWLLLVGAVMLAVTLVGWLIDARLEYLKTARADQTGHLEPLDAPSWPRRLLAMFAIVVAAAVVLDLGLLPPRTPATAGGPGAPPASGEPGQPTGSGQPGGPATGELALVARNIAFDKTALPVPAGKDFTIAFRNEDTGVPHDVTIRSGSEILFNGDDVTGPGDIVYTVPALDAGEYTFVCTFHANMTGTVTAQ